MIHKYLECDNICSSKLTLKPMRIGQLMTEPIWIKVTQGGRPNLDFCSTECLEDYFKRENFTKSQNREDK